MSALAQALIHAGHTVTGSDRSYGLAENSTVTNKLERAGVRFVPQNGSAITPSLDAVVVSTAIEPDNPDVVNARSASVPVRHRSEILDELVRGRTCIAVTGTAGKSTVTGMIGCILEAAGHDPWAVNGAPVLNWIDESKIGNFRGGVSGTCVLEADESDRSLLQFAPEWGVITNLARDHFEIEETRRLFDAFRDRCSVGTVSAVHEQGLLCDLRPETTVNGVRFSHREEAFELSLPGKHNAENGALAAEMCFQFGIDPERIHRGLASFRGIERRLQKVGEADGISVFDDYAHNPVKIRAAWETLAEKHCRIIAVWRPHGFGPLAMMLDDLSETLSSLCQERDRVYVLPVYDAGGTADRSIDSGALVERLPSRSARLAESVNGLPIQIASEASTGDAVLVMGARDPGLSLLAARILEEIDAFVGKQ
jgi:UDP-N-acetylmuramate--alanine ligase